MSFISEHIPELMLLVAVVLAVYFFWSLGWYERHPWPGSTRWELEEQMKRNQKEREKARLKEERDAREMEAGKDEEPHRE